MRLRPLPRHVRRFAADSALGLGLVFTLATLTVGDASLASSEFLDEFGEAATLLADAGVSSPNLLVLAAVVSLLFALNLAFVRHLRRQHVASRRRDRPGLQ